MEKIILALVFVFAVGAPILADERIDAEAAALAIERMSDADLRSNKRVWHDLLT